jgi:uncharacterized protein (DUF1800 family)
MGDASTVLTTGDARHLLRRTGFGAPRKEVKKLTGQTRGQAVDKLLKFKPKKFTPLGRFREDEVPGIDHCHDKWLAFMLGAKSPLQEKLVLFWHDHFATNAEKVANTVLMAAQNALLRSFCKGNFRDFVKAMNRNAAMMEFLDTVRNHAEIPNENYARELMELFTLGVRDSAGNDTYLQEDIVQIARAFTGWDYEDGGVAVLEDYDHDFMSDYPERGPKVIFKVRGGFGPAGRSFAVNGEGVAEIDTVIDILFAHTDSDGQNTVARRMARRLLEYFAHPDPDLAVIDAVVATSGFASNWDITRLLRAILVHDAFYVTATPPPFAASTKKSIKWPIDYVVTTLRLLGMKPVAEDEERLRVAGGASLHDRLTDMGQHLFEPPSVFGWDWENAWVSSATLLARYAFARDVVSARVKGKVGFHPEKLIKLGLTDPAAIVDAVTEVLGVADQLGAPERTVLIEYLTDGGLVPTLNLTDPDVRNTKLHGLFALVLESPAFQLQ